MRHSTISAHPHAQDSGVYLIHNLTTDQVYVGSTNTTFEQRWNNHWYKLVNGAHPCVALQADWATDDFAFEVLECGTGPHLRTREQIHLEQYRAQGLVYNNNNASTLAATAVSEDELFDALYHLLPDPF